MTSDGRPATSDLPARDIVDVRLSAAIAEGGCPICGVRARSERSMMDSIIAQHVLDIGFRGELERSQALCRRHTRELILADRRGPGGTLGSSILYGAMLERRLEVIRGAIGSRGRSLRVRLRLARRRPPCIACAQGQSAVETALARSTERSRDEAWAAALATAAFCLDDFLELWAVAASEAAFRPIAERQVGRMQDLRHRLDGFVDHSSHDRRHLMTDHEVRATDEAADLLGGRAERP
jgi:hypothetical protein